MTLRRLIIAITFIAIFAMAARISMDTDSWWHLRSGQEILETRSVPTTDSYSSTRNGETWRGPSVNWLSQIVLYTLYDWGGPGALNLWVALVVTLSFIFIYFTLTGGPFLRAFALILSAASSAVFWSARPHMVSLLFSAIFLWVLEDYRNGRKERLYLLPILMLVWVNSHPGFAIGFIILSLYGSARLIEVVGEHFTSAGLTLRGIAPSLRERFWPLLRVSLLALLAACINPSGPIILLYPFQTISIGVLRDFILEWQSPSFHQLETQPFLWLLFVTLAALGASRRKASITELLTVSVFAYLGFLAGRNIALFALAAPAVLTRHGQPPLNELAGRLNVRLETRHAPTRVQARLNVLILILVLAAAGLKVAKVLPEAVNRAAFEERLPLGAVEYLHSAQPQGELLNSYNWGGYLIWALPEYPVFVDGRTDLYNDEILTVWLDILGAKPGWEAALDDWGIRLVLMEPNWSLVPVLEREAGWHLAYQDELSVLYERDE